jgi:hypothetical protein
VIAAPSSFRNNARLAAGVVVLAVLLNGCASLLFPQTAGLRDAPPPGLSEHTELKEVPFFPQDDRNHPHRQPQQQGIKQRELVVVDREKAEQGSGDAGAEQDIHPFDATAP